jgi:hypothetical protein
MVKYPADTPASTLGNFAGPLDGTHADILTRNRCTLSDVAGSVERMKSNQIARTLPNALGRRSSAVGSPFADVSGTAANVTAGTALVSLGRLRGLCVRLRCLSRLRLSFLATGIRGADGKE